MASGSGKRATLPHSWKRETTFLTKLVTPLRFYELKRTKDRVKKLYTSWSKNDYNHVFMNTDKQWKDHKTLNCWTKEQMVLYMKRFYAEWNNGHCAMLTAFLSKMENWRDELRNSSVRKCLKSQILMTPR